MADYDSSLPVRTENAGDVIAKIADATVPSQQLAVDASGRLTVKLNDSAGNGVSSQINGTQRALDVGINVAGVQIDPRDIRALTSSDQVTVIQSTNPWLTKDAADGPVAPGAAASFSLLAGGQYNSTLPTLTTGQQAALQVDSSGRLLVISSAAITEDRNYGVVGANTLRVASQIGNATGAADFGAGATGAQTLRVTANQGTSASAANGWFVRPTDGTNNQAFTAAGEAQVSITQPLPAGTNNIGQVEMLDGAGNAITSQVNGTQRALDVGINVAGVQIDPRSIRALTSADVVTAYIKDAAGNAFSAANPLPVVLEEGIPVGTINDYKTAAPAAGLTDNHDYTVTAGKTLILEQIESSASGKARMELQIETGVASGVFTTRFVQFNSTATSDMSLVLSAPIAVLAGVRVRVIMQNRDKATESVYSTICGTEV
jgi:hypothetical protein